MGLAGAIDGEKSATLAAEAVERADGLDAGLLEAGWVVMQAVTAPTPISATVSPSR